MKILAFDSSGLVASVALLEDEQVIAEYNVNYKKTHSQTLLPMLDEIVRMVELDLSEIDAIAVAAGPGSFTGLRIGSATVKGLGLALDKPIISVPTMEGMAMQGWGYDGIICPIMDARRNQVYTGIYRSVPETFEQESRTEAAEAEKAAATGNVRRRRLEILEDQMAVDIYELLEKLDQLGEKVLFLGDAVPVQRQTIREKLEVPCEFAPAHLNRQRAAALGVLAFDYLRAGKTESAADHKPEYLRVSQAERERNAK